MWVWLIAFLGPTEVAGLVKHGCDRVHPVEIKLVAGCLVSDVELLWEVVK